jgi:hypothetical protein
MNAKTARTLHQRRHQKRRTPGSDQIPATAESQQQHDTKYRREISHSRETSNFMGFEIIEIMRCLGEDES